MSTETESTETKKLRDRVAQLEAENKLIVKALNKMGAEIADEWHVNTLPEGAIQGVQLEKF